MMYLCEECSQQREGQKSCGGSSLTCSRKDKEANVLEQGEQTGRRQRMRPGRLRTTGPRAMLCVVLFSTFCLVLQVFIYVAYLSHGIERALRKSLYSPGACSGAFAC